MQFVKLPTDIKIEEPILQLINCYLKNGNDINKCSICAQPKKGVCPKDCKIRFCSTCWEQGYKAHGEICSQFKVFYLFI